MSYILEALRKAEQEREIGRVPGIGSEHDTAAAASGGRWLWILAMILLVNAGLLAYAFWPKGKTATVAETAPDEPARTMKRAQVPVVSGAPVEAKTADSNHKHAEPGRTEVSLPPVELRPLEPLPRPSKPSVVRSDRPLPATSASAAGGTAEPVQLPSSRVKSDNLPVWPQVSAQLFQQIRGGLRLDVHVYSEVPQERFVLINMKKYNQGQRLQEGPLVDEITPEGVILSYQGQRFRVRSQ